MEPHPQSHASPVGSLSGGGNSMACISSVNFNGDASLSRAMSYGPTPLKIRKYVLQYIYIYNAICVCVCVCVCVFILINYNFLDALLLN